MVPVLSAPLAVAAGMYLLFLALMAFGRPRFARLGERALLCALVFAIPGVLIGFATGGVADAWLGFAAFSLCGGLTGALGVVMDSMEIPKDDDSNPK